MRDYAEFIASKEPRALARGLAADRVERVAVASGLFPHQEHAIRFALRCGSAGIFYDTGLGKTACEIEFCQAAAEATNDRALILTPLAVARQIEAEAKRWGREARAIREQGDARDGINICNYDRLGRLDPGAFGAVALDESSILKSFTGKTTRALIEAFRGHRFRLACTATPAPNDHMELGQHAEFLGVMPSNEMLMRWFIADQTQMGRYRLKGHAQQSFWDWMASWARMAASPDDLGFDGKDFMLPPLEIIRHRAQGDVRAPAGSLFVRDLSATNIHDLKRHTSEARADAAAEIVSAEPREAWVIWADTNYEADALITRLPDAVEVRGSHSVEIKEERLQAFAAGEAKAIITKPSVAGMGLNWQHAARMIFVGRSFSYEDWYQAVRRCWRFGQKRAVKIHLIVAEGEEQIGRVIDRKAEDHARMKAAMSAAMRRAREQAAALKRPYEPRHEGRLPQWIA
ncbi:MAG TPA: helicase-related protein [Roseiarcus sp.]|nr:helicase-related protein [Roseiarcus sp.]